MLMLVTADNLVQLFFGWEGVGLASYLLIGFWYEKESARAAAVKAFLVNRVGDFGFALGIFAVYKLAGTRAVFDGTSLRRGTASGECADRLPRHEPAGPDHSLPAAVRRRPWASRPSSRPAHLAARTRWKARRPYPR